MATPPIFGSFQILSGGLWFILILLIASRLRPRPDKALPGMGVFLPALGLRLLGGLIFGLTYHYYFGGGDTFEYFRATGMMADAVHRDPLLALRYLAGSPGASFFPNHPFFTQEGTLWVVKTGLIFSLLSGHSFWSITLGFSLLSFLGSWLFYRTMTCLQPDFRYLYAFLILGLPSVLFWGSGFLKDSLALALLGSSVYATFNLWFFQRKGMLSLLLLSGSLYGLLVLKFYLALLWILATGLMALHGAILRLPQKRYRLGALALLLACIPAVMLLFPQIPVKILTYQQWHMAVLESYSAHSAYSLGELPVSWWGLLKALPLATLSSLTGPFFWQWTHPLIALAGLESLCMLGYLIWVLRKAGPRRAFSRLISTPWITAMLFFSLSGLFIAGFLGQNFGSVVRYRMPFLPFLLLAVHAMGMEEKQDLTGEGEHPSAGREC